VGSPVVEAGRSPRGDARTADPRDLTLRSERPSWPELDLEQVDALIATYELTRRGGAR
jgi:hypothetical protein